MRDECCDPEWCPDCVESEVGLAWRDAVEEFILTHKWAGVRGIKCAAEFNKTFKKQLDLMGNWLICEVGEQVRKGGDDLYCLEHTREREHDAAAWAAEAAVDAKMEARWEE